MKQMTRNALVLGIIGVVSALLLSYTAEITHPMIEQNRQIALRRALSQVLPEADSFRVIDESLEFYEGLDSLGNRVGYAFVGEGGGYQGKIRLMIGITPEWDRLTGLAVLENIETPGLGAKIASASFLKQFRGLHVAPKIEYVQNRPPEKPNQIQAITGATISSRSVVRILNQTVSKMKQRWKAEATNAQ